MFLVKSKYRQPFGTFSGSLEGIELAEGIGVMESHEATWSTRCQLDILKWRPPARHLPHGG